MRYILGIFGFIILAIIAVVLITSTGNNTPKQEGTPQVDTVSFADKTANFTLTSQGVIKGDADFRSIRISINPIESKVQVLQGYQNTLLSEQTFGNNQAAYSVFVHALANAGYSRVRVAQNTNVVGTCPLGNRYLYELNESGKQVLNLWSTSCSRREGTFGGDAALVRRLFQNQIPAYTTVVRDVRL